ncbi:MAG: insulinase family protein [Blastocatellia bacterium]|nr:insulinase family protein [Blastocatellia bacterium]
MFKSRFFFNSAEGRWTMMNAKRKLLSLLLLVGLCAFPAVAQKDSRKDGQKKDGAQDSRPVLSPTNPYREVVRESLLNGMRIITLSRSGDPVIKLDLVIKGGAKFDVVGKTGLAKLTQETLLAVNPNLKSELESLHAEIDWGVDSDATWFHIETPMAGIDTTLEILGRLLVVENIRPDAFKLAQEEHLNYLKSKVQSHAEQADDYFLKALFGEHPYGHNIDGSIESVTAIRQGDVYDYMKRFYIANNAFAVITGNISAERTLKPFKSFFGGWMKGQVVPATFRPPKQIARLNLVKIEAPDAAHVEIRGGVLGLKFSDPDFQITEVLAKVLAARMKKDAEGITVNSLQRILPGPFSFSASVTPDQAPAVSRAITETFSSLTASPVSAEELAAAKTALANEYSSRPPEFYLRQIEAFSLPRNFPLEIGKKIEAISIADATRVSKNLLESNALTVVVLGKVNEGFKSTP